MTDPRRGGIAVLDFGSQYTQLIARRVREQGVYAEVFAFDAPPERINQHEPRGYILSGGPSSVYEPGAPQLPTWMIQTSPPNPLSMRWRGGTILRTRRGT
jgi:GMP synthase (glutamine-hydrolysing)